MEKTLTLDDVAEMARAAMFLKDCGVWNCSIIGHSKPSIHDRPEKILAIADASGETPTIVSAYLSKDYPWRAAVEFNGVEFFCLLDSDSLRLFGYEPEWPTASFRRIRQAAT